MSADIALCMSLTKQYWTHHNPHHHHERQRLARQYSPLTKTAGRNQTSKSIGLLRKGGTTIQQRQTRDISKGKNQSVSIPLIDSRTH
jgi:hypothetical protein